MRDPVVYCADIGSVRTGRFGWARGEPALDQFVRSPSIETLVDAVATDLRADRLVALGFECPLFVPIPNDPMELTRARVGEGNRPWSAGAGCAALAVGISEVVWVLLELRRRVSGQVPAGVRWRDMPESGPGLFLWEAFVSAGAKAALGPEGHMGDAELAVREFIRALPDVDQASAIHEDSVHSLLGAASLRSGWSDDVGLLTEPCVVIRA